jgi:hypothetical protein
VSSSKAAAWTIEFVCQQQNGNDEESFDEYFPSPFQPEKIGVVDPRRKITQGAICENVITAGLSLMFEKMSQRIRPGVIAVGGGQMWGQINESQPK